MPGPPESTPSGTGHRRPSRRAVLIGAAAAVVAAGGGTTAALALRPTPEARGKLVTPLLASDRFTIAHHASWLDWPEESLYAYRRSAALGVDAFEVSLARTSDGVWFGLHDATLDRTSGTSGFEAAKHTWAEVQEHRISAAATKDPGQQDRPYVRFDDVLDTFGGTHTLFVDPKVASPAYYPELLRLVAKHVDDPHQSVIAKGYCTQTEWATIAQRRGFETWGFYYGAEIAEMPDLLSSTQQLWSLVGLNFGADDAEWTTVRALGKTIVGHVLPSPEAVRISMSHGAAGLMISDLSATMGHLPTPSTQ